MCLFVVNFTGSKVLVEGREISKNPSSVFRMPVGENLSVGLRGSGATPLPVGGNVSEVQIPFGGILLL